MNREDLLKCIAETGYNVGFGAKKHFATFDIVEKAPGIISFVSMAFGIYALVFENLTTKFLSASFIVLGIIGLYISLYDSKKSEYEKSGVKLTQLYNDLGRLYRRAKNAEDSSLIELEDALVDLEENYYGCCQSKQILLSDWYAHYKFFWQFQIDWVNEQKNFRFLRDKIPLSFFLSITTVIVVSVIYWFDLIIDIYKLV